MRISKKSIRYLLTLIFCVTGGAVLWSERHGRFGHQPDGVAPTSATPAQPGQATIPPAIPPPNSASTKGIAHATAADPAAVSTPISLTTHPTNGLAHPGIDAFSAWTRQFQDAKAAGAAASLLVQGETLARNRRAELAGLIQVDPEAGLAAAVRMSVRQQLPPEIARHLEERVSGRGRLDVMVADNFETGKREVSREVTIGPRRYTALVYGRRLDQPSLANVSLQGIAIDSKLALHEDAVRPVDPAEVSWTDAASKTCPVSGQPATIHHQPAAAEVEGRIEYFCGAAHINQLNQRLAAAGSGAGAGGGGALAPDSWSQGTKTLLFMRLNFPDDLTEPITESDAYVLLDGVNSWYVENSRSEE